MVLTSEIELGEGDLLAKDLDPTWVDVVPIVENTLFRVGDTEHIRDIGQGTYDAPLVVVSVLNSSTMIIGYRSAMTPERLATFKQPRGARRKEVEAVDRTLVGLALPLQLPVAVEGGLLRRSSPG